MHTKKLTTVFGKDYRVAAEYQGMIMMMISHICARLAARALWDPLAIDHHFWWVNKKMLTCDFIAFTSTQGWYQVTSRVIWLYEAVSW